MATVKMNGTSSAGEKFFLTVPKVWSASGSINLRRESHGTGSEQQSFQTLLVMQSVLSIEILKI